VAVTFSVIVPTGGTRQKTLMRTLRSLTSQLEHGDEIIVSRYDCHWGHIARNLAMPRCAGTHLMFCDDDDSFVPKALSRARKVISENPNRVHIFAMLQGEMLFKPHDPPGCGGVGTPMIVVPNVKKKLGSWGETNYEGDWLFLDSTLKIRGDEPILHEIPLARLNA
jgi:glycosyltransferase involved in cell wall biosynthesis